jgi:shikimate dehydrogenase
VTNPLRLAVLGNPIAHSRSPRIHNAAMRHLGIDGSYEARRAGPVELGLAIAEIREGTLDGINITMPLKMAAWDGSDRLTEEARSSGSVNTLRARGGMVEGHSTDVLASRQALSDPRFDSSAPVLVLGAGGAAAAVLAGTVGREVYLAARNLDRARARARLSPIPVSVIPFGKAVAGALVVNATPLGMSGEILPVEITSVASGLVDLAYGDHQTPAVESAQRSGLPVMDGVEFLVLQAAHSFEWWTGREAPFEVMLDAARKR